LGEAKIADVSDAFAKTQAKLLRKVLDAKGAILAVKLEKFAGVLGTEFYPNRRFGTEMSDYAKAASGVGGIIHSDEDLKKYSFSDGEIGEVRKRLGVSEGDAFAIVAAEKRNAEAALLAAFGRARMALSNVPEEVRKVLPDGVSTAYMRPMPGAARLYPETDLAPVRITERMVSEARRKLPEMPEVKLARLKKVLNPELAEKMVRSRNLALFERIVSETKADPTLAATTLEETMVSLRREGVAVEKISDEKLVELFREFAKGLFVKSAVPEVLKLLANKPNAKVSALVAEGGLAKLSGKELEAAVVKELALVQDKKKVVGVVMAKLRLRADPDEVMGIIKKKA
jgi:glutamyl-tRNA(Gln) amidotransferase subunit E